MKTPMQELIEWMSKVIAALPDESVGTKNQMIIAKAKAESMIEKEKEVIENAYWDGGQWVPTAGYQCEEYYLQTFNTKEK